MSDPNSLQQTVFHDWHVAHGARMVEFGGWHMPVQYSTIVEEHHAVRRSVGLFDVSHMGRILFSGPDACRWLDHVVTNDVSKLAVGQVRYALVTNADGHVLDDVLVYRLPTTYLLVVNASNQTKILNWMLQHQAGFNASYENLATSHGMVALQGPRSIDVMRAIGAESSLALKYYSAHEVELYGQRAIVSRTGYTGEDGFEVIFPTEHIVEFANQLMTAGVAFGVVPAGLGCRDTLRLEAAMPLYGHELTEDIDPLSAGLHFAVKLQKPEFIGQSALQAVQAAGVKRRRVGLQLAGKRIAREGAVIFQDGREVGTVTSGTFSPTLERSIAMAFVSIDSGNLGQALEVDIRGKRDAATVVSLPFYSRKKST